MEVGDVDATKAIVDALPAEACQKVPLLQLPVDVFMHEVFLLLLSQLQISEAVLSYLHLLHIDVLVDQTKPGILVRREIITSFLEEIGRLSIHHDGVGVN